MFENSKWIWAKENRNPDDKVMFKKSFDLDFLPKSAIMNIYCETKYYLYINDELIIFDGGLFRESSPGKGYYDFKEIAPFLKKGTNIICFFVWFFGNEGRNNLNPGAGGLLFECNEIKLFSDKITLCSRNPAYISTGEPFPSYLYGGHNIGFDARLDELEFDLSTEYGEYPCTPWNEAVQRPIPLFKYDKIKISEYKKKNETYIVNLPYAMHFTPFFEVEATGGEIIDIRSDRYLVNGGPQDEHNSYRGHRTEYICKKGLQSFESLNWIFGEKIYFSVSENIKIIKLGYRESSYDSEIIFNNYRTTNERLNKLLDKCSRTLFSCMRENFMDCPDRERGQWIGDISVQAPQVFFVMNKKAIPLLRKTIVDFFSFRKGDVLNGLAPGTNAFELPSQNLNAISEIGLLAEYLLYTGDKEILSLAFEPCISYLKLWNMKDDGLPEERKGDWRWFDHNFNTDDKVLECCWYYSALKFALKMANETGKNKHNDFLKNRIVSIERSFDKSFWKGKFYASYDFADDRANALAVLSGLASNDKYHAITEILTTVFNSSPYMENYVLSALCEMGYRDKAIKRMMFRYNSIIDNENTTVNEDFYILGTKNHAWSGAPLNVICKYFKDWIIGK